MGLDIGTSTTKLIASRLWIEEMGSPYGLPRCQVKEREILYASPIYTTPLKNANEIDMHRLGGFWPLKSGLHGCYWRADRAGSFCPLDWGAAGTGLRQLDECLYVLSSEERDQGNPAVWSFHKRGTPPIEAAAHIGTLVSKMLEQKTSGVGFMI